MAANLLDSRDPVMWEARLQKYPEILALMSSRKSHGKEERLKVLDAWYHDQLSPTMQSRKPKYITKDELCQLMKWKLTRGKFRPRLETLVASNAEEAVVSASTDAFKKLPDISAAVNSLTTLRGVGAATASAVLAAGAPEKCPFLADESVQMIPWLKQGVYTLHAYIEFVKAIHSIQGQLNESRSDSHTWTAHEIELALWTDNVESQQSRRVTDESGVKRRIDKPTAEAVQGAEKKSRHK